VNNRQAKDSVEGMLGVRVKKGHWNGGVWREGLTRGSWNRSEGQRGGEGNLKRGTPTQRLVSSGDIRDEVSLNVNGIGRFRWEAEKGELELNGDTIQMGGGFDRRRKEITGVVLSSRS